MAQQDTGLGWSAKSEWLINTANTAIVNLLTVAGATRIPNTTGSAADIINNGVYLGCTYDRNWNRYLDRYIGCATGVEAVVFWTAPTSGQTLISFGSLTPRAAIYIVGVERGSGSLWGPTEYTTPSSPNRGAYYATQSPQAGVLDSHPTGIYTYPDQDTGWAAISTNSAPFTKIEDGYAVGCLAKWKTSTSAIITTPILISSNTTFTDMEQPTTTSYNLAKLNVLKSGIRFYMSFYDITDNPAFSSLVPVVDLTGEEEPSHTLNEIFEIIAQSENANILIIDSPDPYEKDGESEEGGADGENDEEDLIDFTDPPSTSIGATGLLTIFCPNLSQLQSLGNYMWSTFDVDNWRKIIANPMDAILGLHTIPIPAVITGTKAVKVAGIDTTIDMNYTTVRYIRRSMGNCEIPKKWGAYLDYSPYTKISLFLPFIGFKELDADDIMGKTVSLQYMIDILTGACVAELKCGDTVLYTWSGNCANEVPISGSDWRGAIASAIGIAATVAGTALVTGGATAPMAASMVASVGANSMNLKPTINRSGAISGSAGYMGAKRPYIIRSIPNLVIPADQNKFIGYPSFVTASLGSLTGYNEIASVHLEGIPATGNELAEIESLLKGGVIL